MEEKKMRWLVLSANNVNTDIGLSGPYDTKEAAEDAMQSEFRQCMADGMLDDATMEEKFAEAMEDYTGLGMSYYDGDDLCYWSLQEIGF